MTEAASSQDSWTPGVRRPAAPVRAGQRGRRRPWRPESSGTSARLRPIAQDLLTDPDVPAAYPGADVRGGGAGVGPG